MDWMFQSRSDSYYDEDPDGGSYSPPMPWYLWPLMPIVMFSFMFLVAVSDVLILLFIILDDFYKTAKRVYESGELEFPGLIYTGIVIALILTALVKNYSFDFSNHPFITLCFPAFILLFTLAPLTGLALRFFSQFITSLEKLSSITLILLFIEALLAITLFYLAP